MRIRSILLFASIFVLFAFITACAKEAGPGGTSSITGKVLVRDYNANFTTLIETYYATDEEVFIVYGDDPVYGDKTTTNYDGTFRFDYLRKGNYTVFVYSDDSANYPSQHQIPAIKDVRISENKQDILLDDIIILK